MDKLEKQDLLQSIRELLVVSKQDVYRYVNTRMVYVYFEIGRQIVEYEQGGKYTAEYGKKTLKYLSDRLIQEFGRGFSVRNLEYMRYFFLIYNKSFQKTKTLSAKSSTHISSSAKKQEFPLSWSHYVFLMRLDEPIRNFYEIESEQNNWSLRELKRQFNSGLYERLLVGKNKEEILRLSKEGQIIEKPKDLIKDPYIFEFLDIKENRKYQEKDIESMLIDNLQEFLLELGKGFAFVSRQQRISFSEQHYYIDLVFYNRLLKCFVLFDIKIGELKHQDLGQLQMYVNYYDRRVKVEGENSTIGILLCADKENSMVEMTLPEENTQVFASKYRLFLPTKEELLEQIRRV